MYLPRDLPNASVLITVKTYPLPSVKYTELVCTAGLVDGEKWIRVYPISADLLKSSARVPKYSWVRMNLRRKESDFRPESYSPVLGVDEPIDIVSHIDTANAWASRRALVEREVFDSMEDLIALAKRQPPKSLGTIRPKEIVDLEIEPTSDQWKDEWLAQSNQGYMFALDEDRNPRRRGQVRKLPFNYYFRFATRGDTSLRRLMVTDWEIGALFWKCVEQTGGDQYAANELVRQKYLSEIAGKCDVLFFLGTTKAYHRRSRNPFLIVGVFYPPRNPQMTLL